MENSKQLYDYREPFQAPYLIREIAKNIRLPFVVYAQDFTIAVLSFTLTFLFLWAIIGFQQFTLFLSLGTAYGFVQLFNRVEPDGKRVDQFVKDYLLYLFTFVLNHKVVTHEHIESLLQEKVVYDRCSIKQLCTNSFGEFLKEFQNTH